MRLIDPGYLTAVPRNQSICRVRILFTKDNYTPPPNQNRMKNVEAVVIVALGLLVMFLSMLGAFGTAGERFTGTFMGILIIIIGVFYGALKKSKPMFKVCPYCKRQLPLTAAYCDWCGNLVR